MSADEQEQPMNREARRKRAREERRQEKKARRTSARRSDDERRTRMSRIDDASPFKPTRGDLLVGAKAVAELERLRGHKILRTGGKRG